jgi:hypothetical protein
MTTGSWTVGSTEGKFYAFKSWNGSNGKTEPWQGGIRAKWNSYTLTHIKRTQVPISGYELPLPPNYTLAEARSVTGWSNNDDLRLLNKLAEAIRGHSFDLGINIAEASKSYGTIVSNVRSIGSALLSLKHGNFSRALRTLGSGRQPPRSGGIRRLNSKDLSGRWLETQYAFLPLISQSFEAAKALEAVTGPRVLKFAVGSPTKRKAVIWTISDVNYTSNVAVTYSKRIVAELSEDLSLQRSLGLVNPAEIAWEVVPYSFVVDWFLPIGSYLSAWGIIPKLVGRFRTTEQAAMKQGPIQIMWPGAAPYGNQKLSQYRFLLSRVPSSSLSVPRPTFRSVPEALSPRRILSAISLIHQRLR